MVVPFGVILFGPKPRNKTSVKTGLAQHDFSSVAPLLIFSASAGVALYLRDTTGSQAWVAYAVAMIAVVPLLGYVLLGRASAFPNSGWTPVGFAAGYLGGVALFAAFYATRHRTVPSLLLWLGEISYALYLVHLSVLEVLKRSGVDGVTCGAIGIAFSIGMAWVVNSWVERPSIAQGRKMSRRFVTESPQGGDSP